MSREMAPAELLAREFCSAALRAFLLLNESRSLEGAGDPQEAFAEFVGVHSTYMGGLERGERNLTLRSVERIAGRLGGIRLGC